MRSVPGAACVERASRGLTSLSHDRELSCHSIPSRSDQSQRNSAQRRNQHAGGVRYPTSPELHLHDFRFLVLEMIVDRFDEAIG